MLRTIFQPKSELHDRAVIVRGETVLAAGALLPMPETMAASGRSAAIAAAHFQPLWSLPTLGLLMTITETAAARPSRKRATL